MVDWRSGDVINTQARLRRLSSSIPSAYTVFKIGGTYYAETNTAGGTDYEGADATTVIHQALAALTGGRTWKEKVTLKGQFALPTTPSIPSFTVFDISEANLLGSMISPNYALQTANNADNVDIIGGVVDGDTVCGHGVILLNATNSRILGTEVKNAGDHNIVLDGCTNCTVDAYSHNAGSDGIAIVGGSTRCNVDGNYDENGAYGMLVLNSTENTIKGRFYNNYSYGIRLNLDANNNVFDHVIIDTLTWASGRGIMLDASDTGLGPGGNVGNIFTSPIVRNCPDHGIWVNSIVGYPNSENIFSNPRVELNGDSGINISTFSTYNQIRGGIVKNNTTYGVYITGTGQKVIGVHSFDDRTPRIQTHGVYVNSDDYHQIEECNVATNLTANMFITGTTTTKVRGNIGFVTKNSGTDTIPSAGPPASVTVNHGLAVTPTVDQFTITANENPTNTPGLIWIDTITATQFNVNCENDPGASALDFGWYVDASG